MILEAFTLALFMGRIQVSKSRKPSLPRKILAPYLDSGDHLLKAGLGLHNPRSLALHLAGPVAGFLAHLVYFGVTTKHFHIVECDLFSKPIGHHQFPLAEAPPIRFSKGLFNDGLAVSLAGAKQFKLTIPKTFSEDVRAIVSILASSASRPAA